MSTGLPCTKSENNAYNLACTENADDEYGRGCTANENEEYWRVCRAKRTVEKIARVWYIGVVRSKATSCIYALYHILYCAYYIYYNKKRCDYENDIIDKRKSE